MNDDFNSEGFEDYVDVPGGYLFFRTQGQGRDVVLVNPGATDLRVWESTVSWLCADARVTTFDCRETGLSSVGTEPYSEIEDIAAVMDAAEVEAAMLVGVSDGARRVLAFAHRYPERVSRAVVIGGTFGDFPNPSPEEETARKEMLEHFAHRAEVLAREGVRAAIEEDIDAWSPALSTHKRRMMLGLQVANAAALYTLEHYFGTELDPPVKERFAEITVPVSVFVGGRDFEGSRLWAERIASQAPDATLTVVPEADHMPMLSAPEDFERFLRGVLQEE